MVKIMKQSLKRLKDVFGIHKFNLAMKVPSELEDIKEGALAAFLQVKR